jgi:hypothetical protein
VDNFNNALKKTELRARQSHRSLFRKVFNFLYGLGPIEYYDKELIRFICPSCLKVVFYHELSIICPFCDSEFGGNRRAILEYNNDLGEHIHIDLSLIAKILFRGCSKCGGKIQFIECPHCKEAVNLFAPYDEEQLEAKRYVR